MTTITRYQPLINNRPERNSLGSGPSHAISIQSRRFSWPRKFLRQSFNAVHSGELPLTLSSGWTEDKGRNTIIRLPNIAYNSFSKVWIQLIWNPYLRHNIIMTHFLLIMPYQWYSITKANVMRRPLMCTTLKILCHGILFCAMWCPGIVLI